jgi:hypothetical protein
MNVVSEVGNDELHMDRRLVAVGDAKSSGAIPFKILILDGGFNPMSACTFA